MTASKSQTEDGYKCLCGFVTDARMKFVHHIASEGKREGKDFHKSLGRVNMISGDITMPPYLERTPEQKAESNFGKKVQKLTADGKIVKARDSSGPLRTTDVLSTASEVRFVPRIFTTTYTPIMQQAQDAAIKYYGWRSNMPFENFLDTVLYLYFKEHGITLGQYMIDDSLVIIESHDDSEPNDTEEEKEEDGLTVAVVPSS